MKIIPLLVMCLCPKEVLCNDVNLPWERHYHDMRLYCIGNEFGVCGCVWASCEQDAYDELCDVDLSDGLAVDEPESFDSEEEQEKWEDSICRLGNYGKPHSMDYAWIQVVDLEECGVEFLCKLAEARGAGATKLDEL